MKKLPWLKLRRKTDPDFPYEPPIMLGNKSNGEFFHEQTPRERKIRKEILERCDEKARYLGIDRREFIASAMGMCTSLAVINAASGCGSKDSSGSTGSSANPGNGGNGGYGIPDGATLDCDQATEVLSGDEFILDMQTHHIEDAESWQVTHPDQPYTGDSLASFLTFYDCTPKVADCIGPDTYVTKVFLESDTTVAVLSGFPSQMCDDGNICTNLNDNDSMVLTRDRVNAAAGSQRMVQHCQVQPNDQWDKQAAMMERIRSQYGNHGWKCYPPWGPGNGNTGWWLDDPVIADPFFEKAKALGDPIVCAHKGFPLTGFDPVYTDPKDVGPAAVKHPEVTFVIYHSAFDIGQGTGAYDPAGGGVDRLIRTVEENGLMGKNVYAEMGSAWALAMNDVNQAQHYIGKLLKYLGEDRILWGSECVWFGSPQPQIEAFRTFEISQAFQDQYGYPALTAERRAKIFGLNAAKLYKIDPNAVRCTLDTSKLALLKREVDGELGPRRWVFQPLGGPRTRREFLNLQRWRRFIGKPA